MEKLIYAFWRKADQVPASLRELLLAELGTGLLALGAQRPQLYIADLDAIADGLPQFQLAATKPPPDGMVSFWISSAFRRAQAERWVASLFARVAGYVVSESTILPNLAHRVAAGGRTFGFTQVSFLQLPPRLPYEQWRKIWFEQHTSVGIEAQSTFRYVQNVVVQALTDGAPPYRGIVEEGFPEQALRDAHAFYDAVGDDHKLRRNMRAMTKSAARFLDFDKIDVVPMSEYVLHEESEPQL
jgi:hypothetical protein